MIRWQLILEAGAVKDYSLVPSCSVHGESRRAALFALADPASNRRLYLTATAAQQLSSLLPPLPPEWLYGSSLWLSPVGRESRRLWIAVGPRPYSVLDPTVHTTEGYREGPLKTSRTFLGQICHFCRVTDDVSMWTLQM